MSFDCEEREFEVVVAVVITDADTAGADVSAALLLVLDDCWVENDMDFERDVFGIETSNDCISCGCVSFTKADE